MSGHTSVLYTSESLHPREVAAGVPDSGCYSYPFEPCYTLFYDKMLDPGIRGAALYSEALIGQAGGIPGASVILGVVHFE